MERKTVWIVGGGCIGGCAAGMLRNKGVRAAVSSPTPCNIEGVSYLPLDVRDFSAVRRQADRLGESGTLSAMVYCAGVSMAAPFEYTEEADYREVFEVNYFGFVNAAQAVLPYLKRAAGKIVAVGSMGGTFPLLFDPFYSASKAALDMTVKEMNAELGRFGVTVTSVLPGGTATPFSFHRKIYGKSRTGAYEAEMISAARTLIGKEQGGDTPELVARRICELLESAAPPATTATGWRNKTLRLAKRLLPESLTLRLNRELQK